MAARSSGSKVVSAAVAATCAAIGIGVIYLPFIADRDKMRGLHEEAAPPTSAMLAQEIKKLQAEGLLKGEDEEIGAPPKRQSLAPGSMWGKFR
eukprot:Nitzschia sp. Nitz4//scaffold3_size479765//389306//389584//NITZ4_000166-RA/size479765-processed-gene-1.541-mRNA-1//-1//CDS//3329550956//528//frame0